MTSVYRNIQNVVVKLAGESEGKGNHSLLLNCHYDSVPGSYGIRLPPLAAGPTFEKVFIENRKNS